MIKRKKEKQKRKKKENLPVFSASASLSEEPPRFNAKSCNEVARLKAPSFTSLLDVRSKLYPDALVKDRKQLDFSFVSKSLFFSLRLSSREKEEKVHFPVDIRLG